MKNNKLIAEFMELPTEVFESGKLNYKFGTTWWEKQELSYDVSWDWLIPVVQKLIDVYVSIDEQDEQDLQQSILYDKIDSVYQIVVEIIEKYNSKDRG